MWRPATKGVSGTNDVSDLDTLTIRMTIADPTQVPLGNTRRFGLPEEAPPPSNGSRDANRPPPSDMQYFNGRTDRDRSYDDRRDDRDGRDRYERRDDHNPRREDYDRDRRDDRDRGDRYGGRDERPRWDEEKPDVRGRDPAPIEGELPPTPRTCRADQASDGPRKRKSRWGDESARIEVPGMPVALTGKVSQTELDNYAIHVRLEEINRKLRTGDVVPPDGQRSPSPRPQYDAYGRRTNTREIRYRKKLEDERLRLVDRAMKADPNFRPPADVAAQRRFARPQDKVYIPVKEFPEINFFGLLVGPRGNSLKRMERESGAKISIRGKGSVKEGKGRSDAFAADEDDELHCLIMADDEAKVKECVALINRVIETVSTI